MDHDQRFKALIREFFGDFMRLFFPVWADYLDLDSTEWVDKEVLPNPPEGSRHVLDLVAKLRTKAESVEWFVLVHIEIESPDKTTLLKPRLPRYYIHLREAHELPVLPIVLYLRVGMEGIGVDVVEEYVGDFNVLTLRYHYVGLPSLDAVQYAHGDNWLGVAFSALMASPVKAKPSLGATAIRRLAEGEMNEYQRFLLMDCLQAYLPLDAEGRAEYERILSTEPYSKVIAMNKTPYDLGMEQGIERGIERGIEKGIEQGIEKGAEKALRDVAIAFLESKFRSVPTEIMEKVERLSRAELRELTLKIPGASSLEELFGDR